MRVCLHDYNGTCCRVKTKLKGEIEVGKKKKKKKKTSFYSVANTPGD